MNLNNSNSIHARSLDELCHMGGHGQSLKLLTLLNFWQSFGILEYFPKQTNMIIIIKLRNAGNMQMETY